MKIQKNEPITYFGAIKDTFELDYYGNFKFVMFKYNWFEAKEDKYGLTSVYFNKKKFTKMILLYCLFKSSNAFTSKTLYIQIDIMH